MLLLNFATKLNIQTITMKHSDCMKKALKLFDYSMQAVVWKDISYGSNKALHLFQFITQTIQ